MPTQIPQQQEEAARVVAENLDTPWGIALLPDGGMLVTERPGRVRLISAAGDLQYKPVAVLSQVREEGEAGLLGITLHPDFLGNKYVYLYYSYSVNRITIANRVVRMTLVDNELKDEKIIIDGIPGAANHDGGRIKFGPDRYLYVTTGDAQQSQLAQDTNSLAGKILRVTDEGASAPGNPFGNLVYSYGHRNPQGLAWDSWGRLWATEHGRSNPTGYDELNLIEAGKNYGWPIIQGSEEKPGLIAPIINSGPDTAWAPSGAAFVGWSLFFGGLKGQTLYEADIQDGQFKKLNEHFKGEFGRIRDVVAGEGGMLYMTTSNQDSRGTPNSGDDKIIKVNPRAFE